MSKRPAPARDRLHCFAVLLLTAWLSAASAVPRDVPYEPSPLPVVRAMLELAAVRAEDVVYDLGSGDGRIVIMAAARYGARAVGVEIDPELVAEARRNAHRAGVEGRTEFRQGDLFAANIGEATVVTLFLYENVNLKLREKLLTELRPGTRIVSHLWRMGDWQPDAERKIGDRRIYLWRVPERAN